MNGRVALESVSSVYVGGRRLEISGEPSSTVALSGSLGSYDYDPNDIHHVGQAYVQRFVPAQRAQETPVLLVHGGGMTGSCWETTPDGRPGWLTRFLQAGLPVDVVDNVERGRAGWCSLPGVWAGQPILRGEREMWEIFRIGRPEDYDRLEPFPGGRFPVEALPALLRRSVPRWPGNSALATEALAAVVDELGPHVVVGHSQGGGLSAEVTARPGRGVRALVLLEPHGLPAPGPVDGHPPTLTVLGDRIADSMMWRRLAREATEYGEALMAGGVPASVLDLPAVGVTGNSHLLMMDRNSDEIATLVLDWLAARRREGDVA